MTIPRHIIAIDPGNVESAYVVFRLDDSHPFKFGKVGNLDLLDFLKRENHGDNPFGESIGHMAIEMIASFGLPVGSEVFETVYWIGRFVEAWGGNFTRVYRRDVKLYLCGTNRAKDANVRQVILDRYGGKGKAIGKKGSFGPLKGIKADIWSALAVAITYTDGAKSNV